MSTLTAVSKRINWKASLVLVVVLAVVALLTNPSGPLGSFWAPSPDEPAPSSSQIPFFLILKLAEALTFGAGIAFLVFGFPLVRAVGNASAGLARAAHLSISWLLFSWFPHDSLHIHNGLDLNGLLVIEFSFHLTLMITGVILAVFFYKLTQKQS